MKKNVFVLIFVSATILFTSCGKIPQAEIDAAKAAVEQAKTAQADLYLQPEFFALQDSLNALLIALEEGKSKMLGGVGQVKEKLAAFTVQGTELAGKVETRKEEIKTEVASAQTEISTILEENSRFLSLAPTGKEGKEALEAIKADLDGISTSVSEIQGLVEGGDLLNAQTKIQAAKQKAAEINAELKTVLEKAKVKI